MSQAPPPSYQPIAEAPGATAGMVLGIISIVLAFTCSLAGLIVSIFGLQKSRQAQRYIQANPGQYANESNARVGFICSVIGLALNALFFVGGIVFAVIWLVVITAAAGSGW